MMMIRTKLLGDFIQSIETAEHTAGLWFSPQLPWVTYLLLGLSGPSDVTPLPHPSSKAINRQRQEIVGDENITFMTDKTMPGDMA